MSIMRMLASSIFIVLVLSQASPEAFRLWHWESAQQEMVQVPVTLVNGLVSQIPADPPDNNGENCFELSDQKLTLYRCEKNGDDDAWHSPENWKITEAMHADLNRDGTDEIALVAWRPFAPWPIDRFLPSGGRIAEFHNKDGLSAHLILMGWDGDEYRELWAGSALANPIADIRALDIDEDGYEELIALEGEYDAAIETGNITIWQWQGFGFTLLDRIEGNYSGYAVYEMDQLALILTN